MILPGMDQGPLYDAVNQDLTILARQNWTALATRVDAYVCPSDGEARVRDADPRDLIRFGLASPGERLTMAFSSYAGCFGTSAVAAIPRPATRCAVPGPLLGQADGALTDLAPIRFGSFTDGLDPTMLASERSTTLTRSLGPVDRATFRRYGWYATGNLGDTLFTAFYPPNMPRKVAAAAGAAHAYAASSMHPGGLNVLMGDGSVRFVRDAVDSWPFHPLTGQPAGAVKAPGGCWTNLPRRGVWQALATRAGGEAADDTGL